MGLGRRKRFHSDTYDELRKRQAFLEETGEQVTRSIWTKPRININLYVWYVFVQNSKINRKAIKNPVYLWDFAIF